MLSSNPPSTNLSKRVTQYGANQPGTERSSQSSRASLMVLQRMLFGAQILHADTQMLSIARQEIA
jgi:hypothetical protein